MILERLKRWASDASSFVAQRLQEQGGFGTRTFYAEAFGLLLLERTGSLGSTQRERLLAGLGRLDRRDWEFHWEFNNYALLRYRKASGDPAVTPFLEPLRFRDWHVTNWRLLKALDLALAGRPGEAVASAKPLVERMQLDSGFILDEAQTRSVQYHIFSTLLLWELAEATGDDLFARRFERGLAMARHFILSNGDSIYLGRGQEQIFGYGALLYILALGFRATADRTLLGDLERVAGYLEGFRRPEGILPLVLNGQAPDIPGKADLRDPRYAGWYAYNNYFDYLCFFGYFASRAAEVLGSCGNLPGALFRGPQPYRDGTFLKAVRPGYEAVLALGGGSLTNDMPAPYLVAGGSTLTPCYGNGRRARFWGGRSGIPVPRVPGLGLSLRDFGSRWEGDSMVFEAPFARARRVFEFNEGSIRMETTLSHTWAPLRHLALFLGPLESGSGTTWRVPGLSVLSGSPLRPEGTRDSASGRLALFSAGGAVHRLEFRPSA